MSKDAQYHEDAIYYNETLADTADEVASKIKHEEVRRWPQAVSKQHRFHAKRHKNALAKLRARDETPAGVETEIQHADEITIISSSSPVSDGNENPDGLVVDDGRITSETLTSETLTAIPFEAGTVERKLVEEIQEAHEAQTEAAESPRELTDDEKAALEAAKNGESA